MKRNIKKWLTPMPVFVTRNMDVECGVISIPIYLALLIVLIVILNIVLWGGYGIYLAIATIL